MGLERVLVVDDDKRWRNTFKRILESEGYEVGLAEDHDSAIEEIKNCFYPVVVIDLRLDGKQDTLGLDLIKKLDNRWPTSNFHKIIVSGHGFQSQEIESISDATGSRSVTFLSKGGQDGSGFERLKFISAISLAFARLHKPLRCPLHGKDCDQEVEPNLKQVFVAMPYSLKIRGLTINMDELYKDGIEKPLEEVDLEAFRADESPLTGSLYCNVCRKIQESAICIADITDWNPNVLFELGLMYGLGKTTIIVKRQGSDVPTDLKFVLYVEYDGHGSLGEGLIDEIKKLRQV